MITKIYQGLKPVQLEIMAAQYCKKSVPVH